MSKRAMYFLFFIMVLSVGYSVFYFNLYDIGNGEVSIKSNLKDWLNRGNGEEIDPHVIDIVQLDPSTSYIALFQLENGNIGYAQLIKGWNDKFKIERAGHGTNLVSYELIDTNKGMYGILVGKNLDLKIDHITAKLINEQFSFTLHISEEKKFVKYKKLPSELNQTFPAELTFYDKYNNVINKLILLTVAIFQQGGTLRLLY